MQKLRTLSVGLFLAGLVCLSQAQVPMTGGGKGTPTVASGCSQATTFLARTSGLDVTHTTAYTTLICGGVTDGWITGNLAGTGCGSFFDVLYVFATTDTTTALLNICSTSFGGVANGSPTFNADAGYTGADASGTVYINTQLSPTTGGQDFTANAGHLSAWSNTSGASGAAGGVIIGNAITGTDVLHILPRYVDDNSYYRANDGTGGAGVANSDAKGHYIANRSGASAEQGYKNGSLVVSPNTAAGTLSANTIVVLAGRAGASVGFGSANQIMMASIGGDLTGQTTNFYNRVHTYLQTIAGIP